MHWAITGKTAAEIIHSRANSAKPNMGLTNWRGPKVRREDVAIAKNYLAEPELAFAQRNALRLGLTVDKRTPSPQAMYP